METGLISLSLVYWTDVTPVISCQACHSAFFRRRLIQAMKTSFTSVLGTKRNDVWIYALLWQQVILDITPFHQLRWPPVRWWIGHELRVISHFCQISSLRRGRRVVFVQSTPAAAEFHVVVASSTPLPSCLERSSSWRLPVNWYESTLKATESIWLHSDVWLLLLAARPCFLLILFYWQFSALEPTANY